MEATLIRVSTNDPSTMIVFGTTSIIPGIPGPPGPPGSLPPEEVNILYAAPWGDDDDEGLSWDTAKLTILAAYDALSGGGEVHIADGTAIGGEVEGQGLWFRNDGVSEAGWRVGKPCKFIGHGSQDPLAGLTQGEPVANITGYGPDSPVFHLYRTNRALHFEGLQANHCGRFIYIGIKPDFTLPTTGICCGSSWKNVKTVLNNGTPDSGKPQSWMAQGGASFTFNHRFYRCNFAGKGVILGAPQDLTQDKAFSFLIEGAYLWTFKECQSTQNGGIRVRAGTTGMSGIVNDYILEGDFVNPATPGVDVVGSLPQATGLQMSNIIIADATGGPASVKVDTVNANDRVFTFNCMTVRGPATVVTAFAGYTNDPIDPLTEKQVGFHRGRVYGKQMAPRRQVPGTLVRFPNVVSTDLSAWTIEGSLTRTLNVPDPFGGTRAVTLTPTAAGWQLIAKYGSPASRTWAVGDRLYIGVWMKPESVLGTANFNYLAYIGGGTWGGTPGVVQILESSVNQEWRWIATSALITALGGTNPTDVTLRLSCFRQGGNDLPVSYYAPVAFVIPASLGLSVTEQLEICDAISSYSSAGLANEFAFAKGTGLLIDGASLRVLGGKVVAQNGLGAGNSAAATTLGAVVKKMEIFDVAGASLGYIPIYNNIT